LFLRFCLLLFLCLRVPWRLNFAVILLISFSENKSFCLKIWQITSNFQWQLMSPQFMHTSKNSVSCTDKHKGIKNESSIFVLQRSKSQSTGVSRDMLYTSQASYLTLLNLPMGSRVQMSDILCFGCHNQWQKVIDSEDHTVVY